MVYLNVLLTVRQEGEIETVRELLKRQTELSRREPGCERFEVYQSEADPRLFLLVEQWRQPEDLERHRSAHAFTEIYEPRVLPLVERQPHPSRLLA